MISIEEQLTADLHDRAGLAGRVTPNRTDVQRRSERIRRQRQRRRVAGAALAAGLVVATAATTMVVRDDAADTVRSDPPAYSYVVDPAAGWTLSAAEDQPPPSVEPGDLATWGVSVRATDGGFGVRSALVVSPSGDSEEAPNETLGGEEVYLDRGATTQVIWTEGAATLMVRANGLDDAELGAIVAAVTVSSPDTPPTVELPLDSGLTVAPAEPFGLSHLREASYRRADGATVTLSVMDSTIGFEIDAFESGADDFEIVTLADGRTATLWGDPGVRHLTIEADDGPSIELASEGLTDDELLALVPLVVSVDQQQFAAIIADAPAVPVPSPVELHWGECGDGVRGIAHADLECFTFYAESQDGFAGVGQFSDTAEVRLVKLSGDVLSDTATATLDGAPLPVVAVTGDGPEYSVFGMTVPYGNGGDVVFTATTMVDGVETPVRFTLVLPG